jgi:predicted esterase
MTSRIFCALLFLFIIFASTTPTLAAPSEESSPRYIELWPKGAPGATGTSDEDKPAIMPYLPAAEKNTGAAILICPGGGFSNRATDHEGVLIGQWLKARGIAGFVLRYRIRPLYTPNDATLDGQRAMRFIRAHASEYRIDPNRLGIIGFSAGGELASNVVFKPAQMNSQAEDAIDRQSSTPNFLMLIYGTSPMPSPLAENTVLPPTFMFCTAEDMGHLRGMLDVYANLIKAKASIESHFFANGEHGVGLAEGDPVLGEWPTLMYNWVRAGGFLSAEPRLAVEGTVQVDGQALPHGYVIFTPLEQKGAAPVVSYVFNTTPALGRFSILKNQGLVPGRYRVEVRQNATRWLSNSRNEIMIRMLPKARRGELTDADRAEWNEYARKRDLSPSIDTQRIYRRQRPTDNQDYIVEIKPGIENRIDIQVFSRP